MRCAGWVATRSPGIPNCSLVFFFASRRRNTRCLSDWSSDVLLFRSDRDLDGFARLRVFGGQVAKPDVPVQGWRRRAAGNPARRRAIEKHFVAVAANAAPKHLKAHQF